MKLACLSLYTLHIGTSPLPKGSKAALSCGSAHTLRMSSDSCFVSRCFLCAVASMGEDGCAAAILQVSSMINHCYHANSKCAYDSSKAQVSSWVVNFLLELGVESCVCCQFSKAMRHRLSAIGPGGSDPSSGYACLWFFKAMYSFIQQLRYCHL